MSALLCAALAAVASVGTGSGDGGTAAAPPPRVSPAPAEASAADVCDAADGGGCRRPRLASEYDCVFRDGSLGFNVHTRLLVVTDVVHGGQAAADGGGAGGAGLSACNCSRGAQLVSVRGLELTPLDLLDLYEDGEEEGLALQRRHATRGAKHRRRRRLLPLRLGQQGQAGGSDAGGGGQEGGGSAPAARNATSGGNSTSTSTSTSTSASSKPRHFETAASRAERLAARRQQQANIVRQLAYAPRPMRLRFRRPTDTYAATFRHASLGISLHGAGVVTRVEPRGHAARLGVTRGSVLVAVARAARGGGGAREQRRRALESADEAFAEGAARAAPLASGEAEQRGATVGAVHVVGARDSAESLEKLFGRLGRPLWLRFARDAPTAPERIFRQRAAREAAVARAAAERRRKEAEAAVESLREAEEALRSLADGEGGGGGQGGGGAAAAAAAEGGLEAGDLGEGGGDDDGVDPMVAEAMRVAEALLDEPGVDEDAGSGK